MTTNHPAVQEPFPARPDRFFIVWSQNRQNSPAILRIYSFISQPIDRLIV